MKKNWMAELASHHEKTRHSRPQDKLMILFDIDGTILNMRYMILYVLRSFDKEHDTRFFQKLQVSDISVHENQVDHLLTELKCPLRNKRRSLAGMTSTVGLRGLYFTLTTLFPRCLKLFGGFNFSQIPLLA
jgi:hypothetical protein